MKKILFFFIFLFNSNFINSKWCNFFILNEENSSFQYLISAEVKECAECYVMYKDNPIYQDYTVRFNCTDLPSSNGSNILKSPAAPDTPKSISVPILPSVSVSTPAVPRA